MKRWLAMNSEPSPAGSNRHRAENVAWYINASTWQSTREADACMVPEDWLYRTPTPLPPPEPVPPPTLSR